MDSAADPPVVLRFGPFELDQSMRELREHGVVRRLPAQPFRVLLQLAECDGEPVTRDAIRHCLWGERKYVDVDRGINFCINQIRSALRDPAEKSCYIRTLPRLGYCFAAPVERVSCVSRPSLKLTTATTAVAASLSTTVCAITTATAAAMEPLVEKSEPPAVPLALGSAPAGERTIREAPRHNARAARRYGTRFGVLVTVLLMLVAVPLADSGHPGSRSALLSEKDSVVVADFSNSTGDAVFDDTLTQALIIELRQSPYLNVLPQARVRQTLQMMKRPATERITPGLGEELCLRTGSKALVHGTIARVGSRYLIGLHAISCGDGTVLVEEQQEIDHKENIFAALDRAAADLRKSLGESLPSVQRFEAPLAVTTASFEALQAYSRGLSVLTSQGDAPSVPLFRRAVELDPQFSMAYAALAARYGNLHQPTLALEYATKAYELRARVTERERLSIETRYQRMRGELEKLTGTLDTWISEFPRDAIPYGVLAVNYMFTGQYPKALFELGNALQRQADDAAEYDNLGVVYLALNRNKDAHAALESAAAHHVESGGLHTLAYYLAFVEGNETEMRRQVEWAMGRPVVEDTLLSAQADTEAYFGRLGKARVLSQSAVEAALRANTGEAAALWMANEALREAEFDNRTLAKQRAIQALSLSIGRSVRVVAALGLAMAGDTDRSAGVVRDLERDYPADTMLKVYRLPVIRAAIALSDGHPRRALEILESVRPYDLARPSPSGIAPMYPSYLRGRALLSVGEARAAAFEFDRVLDNPGMTLNSPIAMRSRLERARSYWLARRLGEAKTAYLDFLDRWKGADVDIPLLIAARKEWSRLRG